MRMMDDRVGGSMTKATKATRTSKATTAIKATMAIKPLIALLIVATVALVILFMYSKTLRSLIFKLPGMEVNARMGPQPGQGTASKPGTLPQPGTAITSNTGPVAAGERSAAATGGNAISTRDGSPVT